MKNYPEISNTTTDKELAEIFCKIGIILTSTLQPKDVIERIMSLIGNYFSPQNWSLLLIDEATQQFKFEIVKGIDADKLKGVYIDKGEGIVGWVCDNAESAIVTDTQQDPRFSSRLDTLVSFKTHSIICVPLLNAHNKVIGAIELINKIVPPTSVSTSEMTTAVIPTSENFTINDMNILSAISTFAGIAIENSFLYKKVEELVMVDSLTGINNRHFFNEIFQQEIEKVKRYKRTMCLLMIDIDDFKKINDTFGHVTGDRILRSIADILRVTIRDSDFLARFGGDEFVIIMPEAYENDAQGLVKRIHTMIEKWNKTENTQGLSLNVSIGIHEADANNIDNILINADKNLYQEKIFRKSSEEITDAAETQQYLRQNIKNNIS